MATGDEYKEPDIFEDAVKIGRLALDTHCQDARNVNHKSGNIELYVILWRGTLYHLVFHGGHVFQIRL